MDTPPPTLSACPRHDIPLEYVEIFDGDHIYECPEPLCRCQQLVPVKPPTPSSHGHETQPKP